MRLVDIWVDDLTGDFHMHADCICKEEGIYGKGVTLLEAEINFYDDLEKNHTHKPDRSLE